jgi:hypothetical protein
MQEEVTRQAEEEQIYRRIPVEPTAGNTVLVRIELVVANRLVW